MTDFSKYSDLRRQLLANQNDLQDYYTDLRKWGDESKQKENNMRKNSTEMQHKTNVPLKKSAASTDYDAWNKYDVDLECAKVDSNAQGFESNDQDEEVLSLEEATKLKDEGNAFVKIGKWRDAIYCYTMAIKAYNKDSTYYSNRALCHLKMLDYTQAKIDCDSAISLDERNIKAYYRRAQANDSLGNFSNAESDLLKLLKIDKDNKEANKFLSNIRSKSDLNAKPVSKFSQTRKHLHVSHATTDWPKSDDIILVQAVNKQPHLRSRAPLKRIKIEEINDAVKTHVIERKYNKNDQQNVNDHLFSSNQPKITEKRQDFKNEPAIDTLTAPKTYIQFVTTWNLLQGACHRAEYLKLMDFAQLKDVFKENLESRIFSEIILALADVDAVNWDAKWVCDYLLGLSEVKRFSTLCLFMSEVDKEGLQNIILNCNKHLKNDADSMEKLKTIRAKYDIR